jgi:hypothetical protein
MVPVPFTHLCRMLDLADGGILPSAPNLTDLKMSRKNSILPVIEFYVGADQVFCEVIFPKVYFTGFEIGYFDAITTPVLCSKLSTTVFTKI